ncbi:MAG: hypothetical protein K6A42_06115 [Treponema sp.]|nr:hypothetical protein [Treponema sp.]
MNLKKILAAAFLCVGLTAGAFAKNHPYGMDIAVGIVGVDAYTSRLDNVTLSNACVELFPLKVNTYICPWLDNHLGIYASMGILWAGVECAYTTEINGYEKDYSDVGYNFGFELMAGPAFGVDLGSSSVRFQVGAPLHFQVGAGTIEETNVLNTSVKSTLDFSYTAFGLGLTPQFRFGANKKLSFVVGMDFIFDFVYARKFEYSGSSVKFKKDPFHFGWRPYLGLGINFGK